MVWSAWSAHKRQVVRLDGLDAAVASLSQRLAAAEARADTINRDLAETNVDLAETNVDLAETLRRLTAAEARITDIEPTPTPELVPVQPRFPGDPGVGRLYYGACRHPTTAVGTFEARLGRPLGVFRQFFQANQVTTLVTKVQADHVAGRLPHVSIKLPGSWAEVAGGVHDGWLDGLLDGLAGLGAPVLLSVHHEPENDGQPAVDWRAMQARVIEGAADRAPKVTVVPVLMTWTFWTPTRNPADWQVPEARLFGVDCYNEWSATNGKPWQSLGERMAPVLAWTQGRPIVIGEYGCRTDPSQPGRAAQWIVDAFEWALTNNVVSMAYFNTPYNSPEGTFELDAEREPVFKDCLNDERSAQLNEGDPP